MCLTWRTLVNEFGCSWCELGQAGVVKPFLSHGLSCVLVNPRFISEFISDPSIV